MAKKKLTSAKAKEMLHNPPHGKPLTEKQRKFFGAIANAQNGIEAYMGGLTDKGFNYNGAWGGQFQMGGNVLPGAMGNMYARHGAPSEGKYAKKTLPSAAEGYEVLPEPTDPERKYKLSAVVASAKDILNPLLRSKNPKAYDEWEAGRMAALKKGMPAVEEYYQKNPLQQYLTPSEVKATLSKQRKGLYEDYIGALKDLREYEGISPFQRASLAGDIEKEQPIESLNYGFRFATQPVNISRVVKDRPEESFSYSYDPKTGEYKKLPAMKGGGKMMSYYQAGLDFQPKTISKNGGWLDKYEVPQAQPGTRMASDNTRAPITIKDDTNPETVKSTKSVKAKDNRHWQSDSKAKERINNPNTDFAKNITLDTFIDQIPYSAPILAANAFNKGLPFTALSELVKQPMKVTGDFVMNAIQENPSGYDIKTIEEKIVPFARLAANATFDNPIISQIGKQVITSGETPNSKWYNRQFNLPTLFEAAKSYNVDDNTFTKFIEDNWESSGKNYKKILELANNKFNKKKKGGKIKKDDMGYWNPDNWGKPVEIGSNVITMDGVYEPLIGVSDTGDVQYMEPGEDYVFDGDSVTEYPVSKNGGWLDKYK